MYGTFLVGRLDATASREFTAQIKVASHNPEVVCLVIDLEQVSYISSAGLRVLLYLQKTFSKRGGIVVLSAIQPFCQKVLSMTGFDKLFRYFDTLDQAFEFCVANYDLEAGKRKPIVHGGKATRIKDDSISITILSSEPGILRVVGDFRDIEQEQITGEGLMTRHFAEVEYSMGIGALGQNIQDALPVLGQMMTVAGTMIWVPTSGSLQPDHLTPLEGRCDIPIYTPFHLSFPKKWNFSIHWTDDISPTGSSFDSLCTELLTLVQETFPKTQLITISGLVRLQNAKGRILKKAPLLDSFAQSGSGQGEMSRYLERDIPGSQTAVINAVVLSKGALSSQIAPGASKVFPPLAEASSLKIRHTNMVSVLDTSDWPEPSKDLASTLKDLVAAAEFPYMFTLDSSRQQVREAYLGISVIGTVFEVSRAEELTVPGVSLRKRAIDADKISP